MKKKEILQFAATWRKVKGTKLSEISQIEKDKILYELTSMWTLKKAELSK